MCLVCYAMFDVYLEREIYGVIWDWFGNEDAGTLYV